MTRGAVRREAAVAGPCELKLAENSSELLVKTVQASAKWAPTVTPFLAVAGGAICSCTGLFGSLSSAVPSNRSGRKTFPVPGKVPWLPTGRKTM